MALSAGDKLGPYEIVALIGKGGMGEVYRARDVRLKRDVAVKVLAESVTADPERMARFQREAEVLASLEHPNIGGIYGLVESGSTSGNTYGLALALVEGQTLHQRIADGALPVGEAVEIARQIVAALEYAHERGVIHRDLKPANIKITPEGTVKVLDFGLAKVLDAESAPASGADSPTLTLGHTRAGVILGTAAYMSPEQAVGKGADRRSDIFSFGAVFYEMLTGRRAFTGDTVPEVLVAVAKDHPDWTRLPPETPPRIAKLLRRCLEKDRRERLQAIGEARIAIDAPEEIGETPSAPASSRSRFSWGVAAAMTIVAAGASWIAYRATRPPEPKPLVRLNVDLGPDVALRSPRGTSVIISPDGTRLVYVSQGKLFTRRLDQPEATGLAGTEGAFAPFFSPDSQWIAFFTGLKLKKISVEGGAAVVLCDARYGVGGSWGEDGSIIASLSFGPLSRVPSAGGAPVPVTEGAPDEVAAWPQVLPGAKAVVFTSRSSANGINVEAISFKDHSRKTIQRGGSFGRYLAAAQGSGYLTYLNSGTLFAVPFDPDTLEAHGSPVQVLEQVAFSGQFGSAELDFSQTGVLVYRNGEAVGSHVTVQWLDAGGKSQALLAKPGSYERPRISPDGQRMALEIPDASGRDVWIYDWQRDTMNRLTFDAGSLAQGMNPIWSPDGRYIVFWGKEGIFWTRSDGAGKPQALTQSKIQQWAWSFTSDGKRLAWHESSLNGNMAIWTMPLESDSSGLRAAGKPEIYLQSSFPNQHPMFSPDGRWMAYSSTESGNFQVYVRAFPDQGGKWEISNAGGTYPVWSRNGRELFFRSPENRIMVVPYMVKGDSFVADKPRVWSEKTLAEFGAAGTATYDLAPDGKRIAALMTAEGAQAQQTQNHVTFLENFLDEVRRRVPGGR